MTEQVPVVEKILSANDHLASVTRKLLDDAGVFGINIMASPGAGKTSTIIELAKRLKDDLRIGVIDGDVETSIDADRTRAAGMPSVQINTGGGCHLDANMTFNGVQQMDLSAIDLLIIENVGNLICPSYFDIGTHLNILIASIPEGDDKPYKYPNMYRNVDVLLVNKTDLLPYIDFRMDYFTQGVEILNPGLMTFPYSAKTGEGMDAFVSWLKERVAAHQHG